MLLRHMVQILKDKAFKEKLGAPARETMKKQLMDLAGAFQICFTANQQQLAQLSLAALSASAVSHRVNDEVYEITSGLRQTVSA